MKTWLLIVLIVAASAWVLASNIVFFIKDYKKSHIYVKKDNKIVMGYDFNWFKKKTKNINYPSKEGYLNSIFNAVAYYGSSLPLIAPWLLVRFVMLAGDAAVLKRKYWYNNRIARRLYTNKVIKETVEKNMPEGSHFSKIELAEKELSRVDYLKHVKDVCFEYADLYFVKDGLLQKTRINLD